MECAACGKDVDELHLTMRICGGVGRFAYFHEPDTGGETVFYVCHACKRERRRKKLVVAICWLVVASTLLAAAGFFTRLLDGWWGKAAAGAILLLVPAYLLLAHELLPPLTTGLPHRISARNTKTEKD